MQITESAQYQTASTTRSTHSLAPETCTYCSSIQLEPWVVDVENRFVRVPSRWTSIANSHCGSGNISPRPQTKDLANFYHDVYTPFPALWPDRFLARLPGLFGGNGPFLASPNLHYASGNVGPHRLHLDKLSYWRLCYRVASLGVF